MIENLSRSEAYESFSCSHEVDIYWFMGIRKNTGQTASMELSHNWILISFNYPKGYNISSVITTKSEIVLDFESLLKNKAMVSSVCNRSDLRSQSQMSY